MPVCSDIKLSTHETCPRQYKLRYIDRITPPEGEESVKASIGGYMRLSKNS
jgi:hypothetical protein